MCVLTITLLPKTWILCFSKNDCTKNNEICVLANTRLPENTYCVFWQSPVYPKTRNVCFDNNVITKNMNFVFWVKMFLSKHKFSGFCQNVFVKMFLSYMTSCHYEYVICQNNILHTQMLGFWCFCYVGSLVTDKFFVLTKRLCQI